jgi:hypothetical protein
MLTQIERDTTQKRQHIRKESIWTASRESITGCDKFAKGSVVKKRVDFGPCSKDGRFVCGCRVEHIGRVPANQNSFVFCEQCCIGRFGQMYEQGLKPELVLQLGNATAHTGNVQVK